MDFPFVIWSGTEPLKGKGRFRLVHRGPARESRPDDVPFGLEQKLGVSFMKVYQWGTVKQGAERNAIHSLAHALGQLLTVDLRKLDLNHPLFCETNMAIAECRESRGCDCKRPADPSG